MSIVLSLLFVFVVVAAIADPACASDSAPARVPEILKVSLAQENFFSEIYQNSLAENVFIRTDAARAFPPTQHFTRPLKKAFSFETRALAAEIMKSIGVDRRDLDALRLRDGRFKLKVGGKNAYFTEYGSTQENQPLVTCMVFIEDPPRIHALYNTVPRVPTPSCLENLTQLAQSPQLPL